VAVPASKNDPAPLVTRWMCAPPRAGRAPWAELYQRGDLKAHETPLAAVLAYAETRQDPKDQGGTLIKIQCRPGDADFTVLQCENLAPILWALVLDYAEAQLLSHCADERESAGYALLLPEFIERIRKNPELKVSVVEPGHEATPTKGERIMLAALQSSPAAALAALYRLFPRADDRRFGVPILVDTENVFNKRLRSLSTGT
jgi:hypothetical protein